jgi:hypothetical protein
MCRLKERRWAQFNKAVLSEQSISVELFYWRLFAADCLNKNSYCLLKTTDVLA